MRYTIAIAIATMVALASPLLANQVLLETEESFQPTFDFVWQTSKKHFYAADMLGLDWHAIGKRYRAVIGRAKSKAAAQLIINDMLAQLRTSHTRLFSANECAYYQLLSIFRHRPFQQQIAKHFPAGDVSYPGIGLFTEHSPAGAIITGIIDGSPAAGCKLTCSERLVACDGVPFQPIQSFMGKVGQPCRLVVRSVAGLARDLTVTPARLSPYELFRKSITASAKIFHRAGFQIAYVRLWSYAHDSYHRALCKLLDTGFLSTAQALIVDLRGGWGGANPAYLSLFSERLPDVRLYFRNGQRKRLLNQSFLDPSFRWYRPVCLLVDQNTRSGKEVLAWSFVNYGIGPVVGQPTAGAVVGGRPFFTPDGSLLYLAVADLTCDGQRLEGRPIQPTHVVANEITQTGYVDQQLEKARTLMISSLQKELR